MRVSSRVIQESLEYLSIFHNDHSGQMLDTGVFVPIGEASGSQLIRMTQKDVAQMKNSHDVSRQLREVT